MANYQDDDYDSDPMTPDAEESPPVKSPFIGPPTQPAASVPAQNQALESDAPAPINPIVATYLKNKQDMIAAQKLASDNQFSAQMARALGTFAHGVTGAKGPFDQSGYDALDKSAQTPVANLNALQRAGAQSVADEQAMQVAQEAQKKREAEADPNSAESKMAQNLAKQMMPNSATQFDGLPASRILQLLPSLKGIYDVQQKHLDRQDATAQRLEASKDRAALFSDKADKKATADQLKNYTEFTKAMENFRGNKTASDANTAVVNGRKAMALTESEPTSQNLHLLAEEMGKIASNGVPTESGAKALMPSNLYTKAAEMKAFITGNPSSADVKKYLEINRDYIKQVMDISQKALNDYRSHIAKGWKDRVPGDKYQDTMNDYGLGASPQAAQAPASGQPQSPAKRSVSPQEIQDYAVKHKMDPSSAATWLRSQGYATD